MKKILVSAILLLGMSSLMKAQEEESWSFPVSEKYVTLTLSYPL